MKKLFYAVIVMMTTIFISCNKDIPGPNGKTGKIHIDIGASINIDELGGKFKTIPLLDDFKVMVYQADGTLALTFETVLGMPDTIDLPIGEYYVEAFSDNNLPAEFENPYYHGSSDVFVVSSNAHSSVEVTCFLSNTIVSVIYSENIINNFVSYSTTVSSESGALIFDENETRKGYFQTSPLDISVDLSYQKPDGTIISKNLTGNIPVPLSNRHYQVNVNASISSGMASFLIIQDTTEVILEVVEISDSQDSLQSGDLVYGDLLITEIMSDPTALSDTEGEWFEIYNNSNKQINIQNLILGRDDTNMHTISDSIVLGPGEYYVLSRTIEASDVTNKYVYGSSITLSNTGAILTIFDEEVDGNPGEIIFSVDYGADGFPSSSGHSICLNPLLMTSAEAVLGSSWCISTSVYSTGDLGTPGIANDACQ